MKARLFLDELDKELEEELEEELDDELEEELEEELDDELEEELIIGGVRRASDRHYMLLGAEPDL
jgi:hypothetical protein